MLFKIGHVLPGQSFRVTFETVDFFGNTLVPIQGCLTLNITHNDVMF